MATSIKTELDRLLKFATVDDILPEPDQRRMRADIARQVISEAAASNARVLGHEPPRREFVDGQEGVPFEAVKPDGRIDAEFEMVDEVVKWISTELVRASPIGPGINGHYKDNHVIVVDNMVLEPGTEMPTKFGEIAIMNTQPYARKIERGLSSQAPDGVYQVIASVASHRFGNILRIRFSYRNPLFGGIHSWAKTPGAARWARAHGRRRDAAEWLRRQPAILLTPYEFR